MKLRIASLLALALIGMAALAGGAPWYKWKSPEDGSIVCAQFTPGEGWILFQGPFMDAQCRKPGTPQ